MPIIPWLIGMGLYKLAGLVAGVAAALVAFYRYSFEISLMGAMTSLLFAMFGFKRARTGVIFFVALYVITQMMGVAILGHTV